MDERWGAERVLGLAPDAGSAVAGRKQAAPAAWSQTGFRAEPGALWGLCQGSGKNPYRTLVDLTGPAYSCSCPSRKFPCKHALGLMLLWSADAVPCAPAPADFAAEWLAGRAEKAEKSGTTSPGSSADPAAAAKRVEQRAARVSDGLEELDQWLCDRIRTGLAGSERTGFASVEAMAARMVDAQAPGVASRLRRLPVVLSSGQGWHIRLLEQYGLLRLLVGAHRRLPELPEHLAAAVRSHVGYPIARADVLAGAPVRDTWSVLGLRDEIEERLTSRRVTLYGDRGRVAVVLSFAPPGAELDGSLHPGTSLDADLHFYPGGSSRALVGARHGEPGPLPSLRATDIASALQGYATALAADPWLGTHPMLLEEVVPVRQNNHWFVRQPDASSLPLARAVGDPWALVAISGGEPVTVAGDWRPEGFVPHAAVRRRRLVQL